MGIISSLSTAGMTLVVRKIELPVDQWGDPYKDEISGMPIWKIRLQLIQSAFETPEYIVVNAPLEAGSPEIYPGQVVQADLQLHYYASTETDTSDGEYAWWGYRLRPTGHTIQA